TEGGEPKMSKNDSLTDVGEEIVKRKGNGKNSPVIGNNGMMTQPGDNTKFLNLNIELMNMPSIDLNDVEQVNQRIKDYFVLYANYDMKPTVAGLGMALGLDRRRLWEIKTDNYRHDKPNLPPAVADSIKKAYFLMENLWESYMNSGKINPVSGIFLGKNNFGYQDKTEYVVTPNTQHDDYDPEDIRRRYLTDSVPINSDD
ncbi:MAG: hypothetical protein J6D17_01560, partial [Bacteroides sp.]|nr:hypothetical protein [Bacteroides sp.]